MRMSQTLSNSGSFGDLMEIDDEIWVDYDALLKAARSVSTDTGTRARFMTHVGGAQARVRLAGGLSDREQLMRIYRRRVIRGGELPAGTGELLHQLERETDSQVALFAITNGPEVVYVFARKNLTSLIGCIVGKGSE